MAETGGNVNTARKGKINEWKETYSKEQLKYFNTRTLRHLLISLRYSPARSWYMPRVIVNYFDCMGACLSRLHAIFYRKAIKLKADSWAKEIFGDHLVNSKEAKQSATFFCKYLSKFFTVPTIREAVTISDFPKEPQIVQVMEKFNIIHYVGRYFAIAQSVGSVDFTVIATLQEKYGDNLFVHKSIKKVRKWILKKRERTSKMKAASWVKEIFGDHLVNSKKAKQSATFFCKYLSKFFTVPTIREAVTVSDFPKEPQIVQVMEKFNIIHYLGRYFAIAQSVGPVDFTVIATLQEKYGDNLFVHKSIKKVRKWILKKRERTSKMKAASWVKEIFGDHLVNSKKAKQSATFFCKYLSKFFTVPTIREAVTVSDFPKEPQIVQVMEKFNIIHYLGRYFAIAQSVGPVDFTVIATLQEKYGDNLFVHKSIKKVRKWILKKRERTSKMKADSWVKEIFGDHLVNSKKAKQSETCFCKYLSKFFTVPTIREAVTVSDFPKEPQIVQVMEKFNIIHYLGRYFAIAQSVGPVDFI